MCRIYNLAFTGQTCAECSVLAWLEGSVIKPAKQAMAGSLGWSKAEPGGNVDG
jgi:hypothetical protein